MRIDALRSYVFLVLPLALAVAGCGGGSKNSSTGSGGLKISPGTSTVDTNCTGCTNGSGQASSGQQFAATMNGSAATVNWSISPQNVGSIDSTGQYTPPSYLTSDSQTVTVTATLASNSSATASATVTITPGFLQPLSPENAAVGPGGKVTITGTIAEAGGTTGINYVVSSSPTGSGSQQGLSAAPCSRSANTFTTCSVTYTQSGSISGTTATYVVGIVGTSNSKDSTEVLLNAAGVNSNPATHEAQLPTPVPMGSSGGNNKDYDSSGGEVKDCCGGTLGALVKGSSHDYVLSNNHVLARSDQAANGEDIVQPGLVDENCDPTKGALVGTLTGWLPLSSSSTNADAAIAQITSAVDPSGAILELGGLVNGKLQAAPPGTSSTAGKGETPTVGMTVAKSGRTTGLTCANIAAVNLSVQVDYFKDCAETQSYMTKTYQNQIEITGNQFSDAGDSGSLVVDTGNSEPVGLFFAGGVDQSGKSQAVASPAPDVLNELDAGSMTSATGPYTFVGGADHAVSCLNYGSGTVAAAQARTLSGPQIAQTETALDAARQIVNPRQGVLGVASGKSSDEPGTPAVVVYVSPGAAAQVPATVGGVRTVVVPATASAVATGSAPMANFEAGAIPSVSAATLNHAIAIKEGTAASLMKQNPAFFGVGVGQSYDDPTQAALVIFVDRNHVPATLPATISGLRTRYIVMSRLHVTQAWASPIPTRSRCALQTARRAADAPARLDLKTLSKPRPLNLQ